MDVSISSTLALAKLIQIKYLCDRCHLGPFAERVDLKCTIIEFDTTLFYAEQALRYPLGSRR
jgi:hypothetical protein